MQYREQVVFACPLHVSPNKCQKSAAPLTIIPISINADILIQECLNMQEIWHSEAFGRLLESCHQIIDQYQTEISLIHFPLQLSSRPARPRQTLHKKRSQSESQIGVVEGESKATLRHSDETLNGGRFIAPLSPNRAILGTARPKIASAELSRVQHRPARVTYYGKQNDYRRSQLTYSDSEDETLSRCGQDLRFYSVGPCDQRCEEDSGERTGDAQGPCNRHFVAEQSVDTRMLALFLCALD